MKRLLMILLAVGVVTATSVSMAAMSTSKIRQNSRFLTDKMAYELNLSTEQYNDAYEINFDFIYNVRNLMDDVVRGYDWAVDKYYYYLDMRNDDLRWILSNSQYRRFLGMDYFYRPIYMSGHSWNFRIYINYTNHNHFYFGKPYHYRSYCGGHYRTHYNNISFYRNRYRHDVYHGDYSIRNDKVYHNHRRSDFGNVRSSSSGSSRNSSSRPSSGVTKDRPRRTNDDIYSTSRPENNSSTGSTVRRSTNNSYRRNGSSSSASSRRGSSSGSNSPGSSVSSFGSSSSSSGSSSTVRRSSSSSTRSSSGSNEVKRSSSDNTYRSSSTGSSRRR